MARVTATRLHLVFLLCSACGRKPAPTIPASSDTGDPGPSACDPYPTDWHEPELPQTRYGDVAIRPCTMDRWVFDVDALMPTTGSGGPPLLASAMSGWVAEIHVLAMPADGATVVRQEDLDPITISSPDQWYFTSVDASSDLDGDGETDLLGDTERLTSWVAFGPFDQDRDVQEQGARLYMGDAAQGYGPLNARIVGDVTGDGRADIAVPTGGGGLGVPGQNTVALLPGPVDNDIDLMTVPLWVEGLSDDAYGLSAVVSGGFDADGDGVQDLVVGQYVPTYEHGDALVVYLGPILESRSSSESDATLGQYGFNASQPDQYFADTTGWYQEGGGDMDGDGYEDLVVTNAERDVGQNRLAGIIWVIPGPIHGVQDLDAAATARILGAHKLDFLSSTVATRGDMDADGNPDLVAGVIPEGNGYRFAADPGMRLYLGPLQGTLSFLDGVEFHARRSDHVRIDQDLDGDGISDMIMTDAHMRRDDSGASYDNVIESGTHLWLSTRSMEWPRPWAPGNE